MAQHPQNDAQFPYSPRYGSALLNHISEKRDPFWCSPLLVNDRLLVATAGTVKSTSGPSGLTTDKSYAPTFAKSLTWRISTPTCMPLSPASTLLGKRNAKALHTNAADAYSAPLKSLSTARCICALTAPCPPRKHAPVPHRRSSTLCSMGTTSNLGPASRWTL
jgi:hypothetical protein